MWEFILERYNYWIVIILMMTGLYIVISRGNLVKTVIGLNVFQTSVFIFYITIGKIAGGTAPILLGGHGDGHSDGHGDGHGYDDSHGNNQGGDTHATDAGAALAGHGDNKLDTAMAAVEPQAGEPRESLHSVPGAEEAGSGNSLFADTGEAADALANPSDQDLHDVPETGDYAHSADGGTHAAEGGTHAAESAAHAAEIIYTNPLPHVLILTAIVVGVATTAVGLALAVRIREAYGTIEEDELEAKDFEAEFGRPLAGSETG